MESIEDEQSNEVDDEDVDVDGDTDETDVDVDEVVDETSNKKDIDFVEIGNNVFLNKKTNQTYEIADDDDLDEDIF